MNSERFDKPAFLAIGSELLDGRVHESNALYAMRSLKDCGVTFAAVSLCDDIEAEIVTYLNQLAQQSSFIIVSGGLGPTTDDLTREAIARFCGVGLYDDAGALSDIKAIFEQRKRNFNPTNAKQATFPIGADIIKNPVGTAPGFAVRREVSGRIVTIVALPGVPKEFIAMFKDTVEPLLLNELQIIEKPPVRLIRIFGLPESEIGGRIETLNLDASLAISYRAHFPEIQLKISHPNDSALVEAAMERAETVVGNDYIFSKLLEPRFEETVVAAYIEKGVTVAFAESCTGGGISHYFTNPAGASKVFFGAVVSYSNQAKSELLGVDPELIKSHGAVSAEVAASMALGARIRFKTDVALSITGIAGPDGGSPQKPVGSYFIAFATAIGVETFKLFYFNSTRENFRRYVSYVALDILRRHIHGFSLTIYQSHE